VAKWKLCPVSINISVVSSYLYSAKLAETKMVRGHGGMKNIKVAYFRLEIQIIHPRNTQ
jgi:hypothetical protein